MRILDKIKYCYRSTLLSGFFTRNTFKLLGVVVLLCATCNTGIAQQRNETGLFAIRNYSPKEYKLVPQNFAIVQDSRGVLFFGNNSGILEYDGQNWDTILTPKEAPIHSLTITDQGVIYVGGTGEIGYLSPDVYGAMEYHSLVDSLLPEDRHFDEVWSCFATGGDTVYFQTSERIIRWDGNRMHVWNAGVGKPYHLMFYVDGQLFVRQKEVGLLRMGTSGLHLIQDGNLFAQQKVYFMLPYRKKRILLNIQHRGLFVMKPASHSSRIESAIQLTQMKSFGTNIHSFIVNNIVYNGIKPDDDHYSIGTLGNGVVVIDSTGNLVGVVNKKTGLKDEAIQAQFLDAEHKLWLATNNGISKVDINSPITRFNDQNGLEGTVQVITRYAGKLYVVTNEGVFYLSQPVIFKGVTVQQPHFEKVPGLSTECWDLLPFTSGNKSMLLVASNNGVFQLDGNKLTSVFYDNSNVLCRSVVDPNRVFIGSVHGISSIYRKDGKWINEGRIEKDRIKNSIRTIAEDSNGTLWLGNEETGVAKLQLSYGQGHIDSAKVEESDTSKGLPNENVYVKRIGNHVVFATAKGLYKYNYSNGRFSRDMSLGKQFSNNQTNVFRIDKDPEGNIWMVTVSQKDGSIHVGYLKNPGKQDQKWDTRPFAPISKSITLAMYHDSDGITWLGGPDGLIRYDNRIKKNYKRTYYTLIRHVTIGNDSSVFYGAYYNDKGHVSVTQPARLKPVLKYKYNSLVFRFAAPDFDDESATLYSYYLEGFDTQWSDWKHETKANYTNLPGGHYYFHVKAKNIFGNESKEAVYEFTILSPWYFTIWAYAGYALFFIFFVYGAITVSTRSLKNIINERTTEIVKQKEVIELKNKDITDSINYAKRIQEAILPTRERFKARFPDSFILFKPKDIVSGDFYWMSEKGDTVFVAASDCTGHGVPGAMVSVICSNALNAAVKEFGITDPGKILDKVRDLVIETFEKSEKQDIKDGMDISLCAINTKTLEVKWSGANNPLWYVQANELKKIKADRQPLGKSDNPQPFNTHKIKLQKNDELYLFTDGYADQFGGVKGKKFKYKQLEEKILEGCSYSMVEQKGNLDAVFEKWRGALEQVDDVLIMGIRL